MGMLQVESQLNVVTCCFLALGRVCVCVCVCVFACRANRGATCDDTGALLRLVAVVIARCLSDLCFVFCSIPWHLASSQPYGQPWGYSPKQAVCVCVFVFACRANRGATCDDTDALLRLVAVVIARCLSALCFVFVPSHGALHQVRPMDNLGDTAPS